MHTRGAPALDPRNCSQPCTHGVWLLGRYHQRGFWDSRSGHTAVPSQQSMCPCILTASPDAAVSPSPVSAVTASSPSIQHLRAQPCLESCLPLGPSPTSGDHLPRAGCCSSMNRTDGDPWCSGVYRLWGRRIGTSEHDTT